MPRATAGTAKGTTKAAKRPAKKTPGKKAPRKATPKVAAGPSGAAARRIRRDGSLESVGRTVGGTKVGPWTFYHHDGKTMKAKGRYDEDGLFTGLWTWCAANGALRQQGRFDKGVQVGLWKRWYGGTDQLCDVGRYAAGRRTGEWTFYGKDGRVRRRQTFR